MMADTNFNYQSIQNQPHHEHEVTKDEEEEEPKVSTLELFSYLVIVVAIHVVATPLEESHFNEFGLYFARVFYLWLAWHIMTIFMNAAVLMKSSNCPIHNSFIFVWMAFILHMSQAFSVNNYMIAALWYLFLRAFETAIYWRSMIHPYKAIKLADGSMTLSVSDDWLKAMSDYIPVMVFTFIFCEFIPLSLAVYWGHHDDLYSPMVATSIVLIILSFFVGAVRAVGKQNGNQGQQQQMSKDANVINGFDVEHFEERYELISLIFTGELCFAAGTPGNSVGAYGVLFMAFSVYLLTFKSHPLNGVKFWARGILYSVAGLFLYAGIFCAIPAIGSAFVRIVESEQKEEEEEEVEGSVSAGELLCYSAGAFMILSAFLNLMHVDPDGSAATKISLRNRGLIRIFVGLIIWSLSVLIPDKVEFQGAPLASIVVPFLALVTCSIEIWAVGSLKIAFE